MHFEILSCIRVTQCRTAANAITYRPGFINLVISVLTYRLVGLVELITDSMERLCSVRFCKLNLVLQARK